jgi:pyridoxal phosphate enzyme (YggS family)
MAESPLAEVEARIGKAAALAGRKAGDVSLIAVSKTQPVARIEALIAGGQRDFGENRVQEAQAKWFAPGANHPGLRARHPDLRLHLIGRLQSNKAEEAVALFDAIHSVDRPSLVAALARAMDKIGRRPDCFLQVNIGDEPQKGGCPVAALPALVGAACVLPVAGLMCIPPAEVEAAPYFALLAELARRHGFTGLSMGMSADFETAVMLGATHVRVGTALFGSRGV